jgi:predicted DNA binding CopG/RHH family protein
LSGSGSDRTRSIYVSSGRHELTAQENLVKPRKKIPTFKDEDAEREFWAKADSTEYVDWSKAQRIVLPNFRPTLRTISLRLPESMIAELKRLANQRDVPYQSLLKVFLAERINEERKGNRGERNSTSRRRAG